MLAPPISRATSSSAVRRDRQRLLLAGGLATTLALLLFVLANTHALPQFVYDDGGITLRYATRLAQGLGFSYNDGERVNGCSDPLYTLALSMVLRAGATPSSAVQLLGALAYALTTALLVFTLTRYYSLLAACIAFTILASNEFSFYSMFNGLETPFTVLFGALLFQSLHTRNEWFTGAVLGALVANKLDCGLAAIAYGLTLIVLLRRLPWRATIAAAVTFLPMAGWLFASFDSILPNSMLVKLASTTPGRFAHTWVLGNLRWGAYWPMVLSATALLVPLRRRGERLLPTLVIAAWAALHIAVYSLVDMGSPYPWYAVSVVLLLTILASVGVDALAAGLARALALAWGRLGRPSVDGFEGLVARVHRLLVAVGAMASLACIPALLLPRAAGFLPLYRAGSAALVRDPEVAARKTRTPAQSALSPYSCGDLARLAAGAWLRRHGAAGEVLETSFGLPAFAYAGPVYDSSGLNSAPQSPLMARAVYSIREGDSRPGGDDWELVALFYFPAAAEHAAESSSASHPYRVYARPRSRVWQEQRSFGVPDRADAPLCAEDLPLLSRAWRDYARLVLPDGHQ